jgi:hypothetical protein
MSLDMCSVSTSFTLAAEFFPDMAPGLFCESDARTIQDLIFRLIDSLYPFSQN